MDEQYVCKCSLVTQREIEDAVINNGVRTIDELKSETMATGGCGRCKIMCQHIIDKAISAL